MGQQAAKGADLGETGYQMIGRIGSPGAYGDVYKVCESETGNVFAAKLLKAKDSDALEVAFKEASVMRQIRHENVVRVHRTFVLTDTVEESWFARIPAALPSLLQKKSPKDSASPPASQYVYVIIMEYCPGGDLNARILPPPATPSIVNWYRVEDDTHEGVARRVLKDWLQALRGIAHLHSCDVVHGDIKPGNVVVSQEGTLKWTDFGFAARLESSEEALEVDIRVIGTPFFASPEKQGPTSGLKYDGKASDMWSLGTMLCLMLMGVHPQRLDEAVPLSGDPAALFTGCEALMKSLVVVDPTKRLTAAAAMEFATSLEERMAEP